MSESLEIVLANIKASGVVQGVGFRPFVYNLAKKHNLNGWVLNTSGNVQIAVEGSRSTVESFYRDLQNDAPPISRIEKLSIDFTDPQGFNDFQIRRSISEDNKYQLVSPDIATCSECKEEIFNSADRRYRYPFTNCTNCGPRFTIIEDIPYDRDKTTMKIFKMCPECQAEYDNPLNRRFHAQPNACPVCGPELELWDSKGEPINCTNIISKTAALLKEGKIVAIKGLGGFLLACDAISQVTVALLRERKRRPSKPFAIMFKNIEEVEQHCILSPEEKDLLLSPPSPIVLLRWKKDSSICRPVAPDNRYLGVMLPYTPMHHLLLNEVDIPLVMTSGNLSEEPIARDNQEAVRRLSGIADFFLVNNRDIYARYDDSVTFIENNKLQIIRRARGYAPFPVRLPFNSVQILATGADEKNTFCLTRDNYAFVSQHIGDLDNLETEEHLSGTLELYRKLFRIEPEIIAYDMHPDYRSSKFAQDLIEKCKLVRQVAVQHHHAHIASCMADNGLNKQVIGVALDGTGYGIDGKIWGSEFMIADYHDFTRMGHLEYLPLPGGDISTKRPYRIAASYIMQLLGSDNLDIKMPFLKGIKQEEIDLISQQIELGINTPLTSSMGRLFDAVSALTGIRTVIDYEAQAAIELEMAAYESIETEKQMYSFDIKEQDNIYQIKIAKLLSQVLQDLKHNDSAGTISARFHNTAIKLITDMCDLIRQKTGIKEVALSGGVFQNRILISKTIPALEYKGFKVYVHSQVPTNDGGISLGQAAIAGNRK